MKQHHPLLSALAAAALCPSAASQVLANGGFELMEPSTGFPFLEESWSGDNSARSMGAQGISPAEGMYMLECINTVQSAASPATSCEIWQFVDVTPFTAIISTGNAKANLSLLVNRVLGDANTDTEFGGVLVAYDTPVMWDVSSPTLGGTTANSTALFSDGDVNTWESIDVELDLPVGTEFVLVRINASENVFPSSTDPEFDGHYIDAVSLSISADIGTNYCGPAVPNTTGNLGTIAASGSEVVSSNGVTLSVSGLPTNEFGIFIVGQTQGLVVGPGGSQGNLCLVGSIGRYNNPGQLQNSGSTGSFALPIDLTMVPSPNGSVSVQAGETWNFQGWYRDFIPGSGPTSNFTDGVSITFQ